jgi:hypothetical protein
VAIAKTGVFQAQVMNPPLDPSRGAAISSVVLLPWHATPELWEPHGAQSRLE